MDDNYVCLFFNNLKAMFAEQTFYDFKWIWKKKPKIEFYSDAFRF